MPLHIRGLSGRTGCGLPVEGLRASVSFSAGCPGCLAYRQELTRHARALWPFSPGARPPDELVLTAPPLRGLLPAPPLRGLLPPRGAAC